MHLLPVAIKIFFASHIYVHSTLCIALATVGAVSLLYVPYLIIWAGVGCQGTGA